MKKLIAVCAVVTMILIATGVTQASTTVDFGTFNIRNNDGSITSPWDSDVSIVENIAGDGFSATTPRSGQKVGYGTNAFDGGQINLIQSANFVGSSSYGSNRPYLNMWVTDGTNYAIISSENEYLGTNFTTRTEWKVFEYNTAVGLDWLFDSGTGSVTSQYLMLNGARATLGDLSDGITFADPGSPYPTGVGTGAPRGGYGFNVIFGDTQSNFLGNYQLSDLTVTYDGEVYAAGAVVPVPGAIILGGLGVGLVGWMKRRKTL